MSAIKTRNETKIPSENVTMDMTVDIICGQELDTRVVLNGEFFVCGEQRHDFAKKLGELIDEYRI